MYTLHSSLPLSENNPNIAVAYGFGSGRRTWFYSMSTISTIEIGVSTKLPSGPMDGLGCEA